MKEGPVFFVNMLPRTDDKVQDLTLLEGGDIWGHVLRREV
jgi:hypothetical protein